MENDNPGWGIGPETEILHGIKKCKVNSHEAPNRCMVYFVAKLYSHLPNLDWSQVTGTFYRGGREFPAINAAEQGYYYEDHQDWDASPYQNVVASFDVSTGYLCPGFWYRKYLEEDLTRRDFYGNTLSESPVEEVCEYTKYWQEDGYDDEFFLQEFADAEL